MSEKIKILIVDDLDDNRMILKVACRKLKEIEIYEACDGLEAIEQAKAHTPDIILMDVMMPNMDGFEATKAIKGFLPNTIVIVVSAIQDEETENRMISIGATAYLTKPVDLKLVRYKLQNFIDLLKHRRHAAQASGRYQAVNPFSNDVRSMKVTYHISGEEELMDFGTWLMDQYYRTNHTESSRFDRSLKFFYHVLQPVIRNGQICDVIVEDGYDMLYVSFVRPTCDAFENLFNDERHVLGEDLREENGFVYVRVCLSHSLSEESSAPIKQASETPPSLAIPAVEEGGFIDFDDEPSDIGQESPEEARVIEESEREMLRQHFDNKITADAYVDDIGGELVDEIHDLVEKEEEWEHLVLELTEAPSTDIAQRLGQSIASYSTVINNLYEFQTIAYALSSLSVFLQHIPESLFVGKEHRKITMLLEAIRSDLVNWRNEIFIQQSAQDIHYLDASLLSSCMQLESILTSVKVEDDSEDELELF